MIYVFNTLIEHLDYNFLKKNKWPLANIFFMSFLYFLDFFEILSYFAHLSIKMSYTISSQKKIYYQILYQLLLATFNTQIFSHTIRRSVQCWIFVYLALHLNGNGYICWLFWFKFIIGLLDLKKKMRSFLNAFLKKQDVEHVYYLSKTTDFVYLNKKENQFCVQS